MRATKCHVSTRREASFKIRANNAQRVFERSERSTLEAVSARRAAVDRSSEDDGE